MTKSNLRNTGLAGLTAGLLLAGCSSSAHYPESAGFGQQPPLPQPEHALIPTLKIADAVGWKNGAMPKPGAGLKVNAFAQGLDHPRWLYVLPNGDVLVAETNAPPKPDDEKGLRGWVQKQVMKEAGSVTPSANRITLWRDTDGDGVADQHWVFLSGLSSPFGMVLAGNDFYVADSDALLRFRYTPGETSITGQGEKVIDLPAGTINHHWTKNVVASADGKKLYVSIGSNSNAAENGIAAEDGRADIWEVDPATGEHRVFASGLRNPNGMGWDSSGRLWVAVNERDELGSDLVPDYMTSVKDGGFYGWPYSYYGNHIDTRVTPQQPDMVAKTIVPDYALGAHTASLGLTFANGSNLGPEYSTGVFVGQHGSWNREPRSGYRVIFVPFSGANPSGPPVEVLGGFLTSDGKAQGRPVGVAIDKTGALLVADDVGNTVWRVTKQ